MLTIFLNLFTIYPLSFYNYNMKLCPFFYIARKTKNALELGVRCALKSGIGSSSEKCINKISCQYFVFLV